MGRGAGPEAPYLPPDPGAEGPGPSQMAPWHPRPPPKSLQAASRNKLQRPAKTHEATGQLIWCPNCPPGAPWRRAQTWGWPGGAGPPTHSPYQARPCVPRQGVWGYRDTWRPQALPEAGADSVGPHRLLPAPALTCKGSSGPGGAGDTGLPGPASTASPGAGAAGLCRPHLSVHPAAKPTGILRSRHSALRTLSACGGQGHRIPAGGSRPAPGSSQTSPAP